MIYTYFYINCIIQILTFFQNLSRLTYTVVSLMNVGRGCICFLYWLIIKVLQSMHSATGLFQYNPHISTQDSEVQFVQLQEVFKTCNNFVKQCWDNFEISKLFQKSY